MSDRARQRAAQDAPPAVSSCLSERPTSLRKVASSSANSASAAPCRATTTTSSPRHLPSEFSRLADSRSRRRILLRLTAPPSRELTEYPNRQGSSAADSPLSRTRSASDPLEDLTPSRKTASKSDLRRKRWSADIVKHRSTAHSARIGARSQAGRQSGMAVAQTTVNRRRPRARRRLSTTRPPRLDMRLRNPCFRLRGIRFGWYVRFGIRSLTTSRDTRARWSKNAGQVVISIRQQATQPQLSGLRTNLIHCAVHCACSERSRAS